MSFDESRRWPLARQEVTVPAFVPLGEMITPSVNKLLNGDYATTWEVEAIPFETAAPVTIEGRHIAKVNWLNSLPPCFLVHETRAQYYEYDRLDPVRGEGYAVVFDEDLAKRQAREPYLTNKIFITLVLRLQQPRRKGRFGFPLSPNRSREQILRDEMQNLQLLEEAAASFERMLQAWRPRRLAERVQGGVKFTEFGEFASLVINGQWSPVRAGRGSLHRRIPNARASFRNGQVELRGIDTVRYATLLDPLEYGDGEVEPGTFNAALYEGIEYIETLTFAPLNRHDGVEKLKLMRRQLLASQDPAASQIAAMEEAISEASDGRGKIGEFHCSYAVFADTPQDSKRNASRLASAIGELTGIRLVRIDLLADRAWYAQCPGNSCWRARKAHLTTRAFAALAANHGFYQGKRDGNPWGQALLMARARSRQKVCVNLHKSPPHEESEGKKYPGATLILGPNGTGKTVLEAAFLLQSRRWSPAPDIIVLDKDRSLELAVRAMRGKYKRLAVGEPTGLNPFQWKDTPAHRAFWRALVLAMVYDPTLPVATTEKKELDDALAAMSGPDFEVEDRGVSTLCGLLPKSGPKGESSSIRTRLMRWQAGEELGWVFDEAPDDVPHDAQVAGFDYTEFLPKDEIRTPVLMALLQYAEDKIDGRRLMLVMEEAWKPLKDPVLASFAHDKAKTIRKKNGLPIFTTQEPGDLSNDNVGDTLRSQAASIICFPDPGSSPKAYLEGLRLTEAEYEVVRTLGQHGGRYFFFKQGEASCVVEFDLTGMDEHIWMLSGAEDNVRLLDGIRGEVGDDPDDWMPVLFQRIRERELNHQRRSA